MNMLRIFCLFLLASLVLSGHSAGLRAQNFDTTFQYRYTIPETIGFAYHSLAKWHPRFEFWIAKQPAYIEARPSQKGTIMVKEKERLEMGYVSYSTEQKEISIPVNALVTLEPGPDQTTKIRLELTDAQGPYLVFEIGQIWIAVILNEPDYFFHAPLSTEERGRLTAYAGPHNLSFNNMIDLVLQPISADRSAPLQIEGVDAWLMMADIKALRLRDEQTGALLWERLPKENKKDEKDSVFW
ncbi:MAG: hypothetical protein H6868_01795 [Rhodospirillales bacterium]|nr:hypothetical protein [Rhodospirillales bacterium]